MAESAFDRKFFGNVTVEQALYIGIFLIAIVLRTYALGVRPYHHDESIHAFYSWKITTSGLGDYRYDPVYHGPVLYYASALVMALFGDNDFTGRLSAVLFGLGVLAFAWPLRRYLGRSGALVFLILLTFSPSFVYFTRFIRHDIYMALGVLMFVFGAFRYGDTHESRFLFLSGTGLAIAFTTKEDMYAIGPALIFAFVLMLVWEVVHGSNTVSGILGETRALLQRAVIPLATTALIFAGIWIVLYTSFLSHPENWNAVTRALKYWWGQHQIKRIGGPWWYYLPQLTVYDPIVFFGALVLLAGPLVTYNRKDTLFSATRIAVAVGLFIFFIVMYNERALPAADQWKSPLVLVLVLGIAQIGIARVWLPDRFTRFAVLWSLATLVFYGWAQEKVPWLLVPQVLPLAIVASVVVARSIESGTIKRLANLVPLAAVSALTLWTLIASNYLYDAPIPDEPKNRRHAEMLAYVQSTYDIPKVMNRIEQVGSTLGTGTDTRLACSGDATWPFSWYLRHYPVNWSASVRNVDTPVVIVDPGVRKSLESALAENYEVVPFEIRGWWEPSGPKDASLPEVMRFLVRNVVPFLFNRYAWSGAGSSDAVMFVHKDPKPGMTFAKIAVEPPPSSRSYPRDPGLLSPLAVWGGQGSSNGQFNEPRALANDASGNLYVVDSKNSRIQKLSPNGAVLGVWGGAGAEEGKLKDPCGIAVAPDGSVYVADTWNHRIQKFDSNGNFLLQWNAENPGFWGPRGVAVGADGHVYVTDTGNKRVLAYTGDGQLLNSWGTEGSKQGQLIEPVGIAVDGEGNVVVADTGNRRLQVFRPDGTYVREVPVFGWEEFYTEPYLSTRGGDIFVTDSYNHRFSRYSNGQLVGTWGKSGSAPGDLNRAIGVSVDASGNVYIADTFNHRIQKFSADSVSGTTEP